MILLIKITESVLLRFLGAVYCAFFIKMKALLAQF